MKIKRFVAPDMRTAFAMVRQEHGPDAVILSNRVTEDGVEIVAASNYDEALVKHTLEAMRPANTTAPLHPLLDPAPQATAPTRATSTGAQNAAPTLSPAEAAANYFARRQATAAPATPAAPAPVRAEVPVAPPSAPVAIIAPVAAANEAPPRFTPSQPVRDIAPQLIEPTSFAAKLAACLPAAPANEPAPAIAPHAEPAASPRPRSAVRADIDDTLDLDAMLPSIAPPVALPEPAPAPKIATLPAARLPTADTVPAPAAVTVPTLTVVADNAADARESDAQLVQMRAELAAMREMIEREMHRLTDERLRGSPVRMQAMELMEDYGFDAGITRDIALQIPADTEAHRGRGLMLGLLSKKLPVTEADPLETGGVVALVGPTGAGKTTTIAKLAACFAQRHNARDVALVTTDTVRIGGREQLHGYGRQLGIAVHEADSAQGLALVLERLRDYKLVLIDTAGLGQRDRNLVGQLNWLRASGQVQTLLCLPANSHFADLDEVVRRFSTVQPQGVVLTKLDETGRLGSALSVVVDHQLPMAWVTDGQRVPDDLHRANSAHLVLRLDQLRREADEPCSTEATHVA
ncbi:flagellar biosynthesis protein FlhF [Pseudoxanthomonas mexicana]|uniref:Flagellar biosynthesis protein FlhF n=1 Tax=Pseudoxanthomonas mexicana TaxID=128785 RepID=A0ABX6RFA3_PSEMX|nr:flagellar biosynthesis protein FlhF [Pseudoxanthomonas mexicana]QND81219.1 flagellar biosynthesis protein FlhF [Pseudoxanthomonas mexicana]